MYEEAVLSEHVALRLTPEVRRKLVLWACAERRAIVNLVYTVICQAIADEEERRGKDFELARAESKSRCR
jgi:hypothetical protein